jgi:hypothetical protein
MPQRSRKKKFSPKPPLSPKKIPVLLDSDLVVRSSLKISGIFTQADVPLMNGVVIQKAALHRAVDEAQPAIRSRTLLGQLGQPVDPSTVPLAKVSHVVTRLEMDDTGAVHGELEILDTPEGLRLRDAIESGTMTYSMGVALRGCGDIEDDVISKDFRIVGYDLEFKPPKK